MDPKEIVRSGYNAMAEHYLASKDPADATVAQQLSRFTAIVPAGESVLDLGCGAGVPATVHLVQHYNVTGVDISERQLELARRLVPAATFIRADMAAVDFPAASFAGVTAFYSIIHLPREEQPALLARIHSWLKPGGVFLANWSIHEWEGSEANWEGWGASMWWSHRDAAGNLDLLRESGFSINSAEQLTSSGETWLWVLATRE